MAICSDPTSLGPRGAVAPGSRRKRTVAVEESSGDGNGVHFHVGEHDADFERMDEIGFAGGAMLSGVVLLGEFVGALDEVEIVVGTVFAQLPH